MAEPSVSSSDIDAAVLSKAKSIVIDSLEFKNAPVDECVTYLCAKVRDSDPAPDPAQRGVGFILQSGEQVRLVTLSVKNVTASQAAQMIAAAAGLDVAVFNHKINIHPPGAKP